MLLKEARTNLLPFIPFGAELQQLNGNGNGNTVTITASANGITTGLTNAGLSNWKSSHHDTYALTGENWTCDAVTSPGSCVIATSNYGAGHITVTGLNPSYHSQSGAGTTGALSQN